jgi:hypothetical protein
MKPGEYVVRYQKVKENSKYLVYIRHDGHKVIIPKHILDGDFDGNSEESR